MKEQTASEIRRDLQGDTEQMICNKEAGSYSRLWGRDCWVADSMLKLIRCHIETLEQRTDWDKQTALDALDTYCGELQHKNHIGDFPDQVDMGDYNEHISR